MPQDTITILPSTSQPADLQKPTGSTTSADFTAAGGPSFSLFLQASQQSITGETGKVLPVPQVNPEGLTGQQELPQDGKALPQVVTAELSDTATQVEELAPGIVQKLAGAPHDEDDAGGGQGAPLADDAIPFSPPAALPTLPDPGVKQSANATAATIANAVDDSGLANRSIEQRPLLADTVNSVAQSHQDEAGAASLSAIGGDKGFSQAATSIADNLTQMNTLTQAQAPSAPSQVADKAVISLPVETPLHAKAWDDEIGNHVQWLLSQKMQVAELRLNPPNLGNVDVRVQLLQDDQLSVQFHTPHALVKDSLEASLPRLRELMNDNGLNLVNVDVAQHSYSENQQSGEQAVTQGGAGRDDTESMQSMLISEVEHPVSGRGLLDLYA